MLFVPSRHQVTENGSAGGIDPARTSAADPVIPQPLLPPQVERKRNQRIHHATKLAARILDHMAAGDPLVLAGGRVETKIKIAIDNMVARGLVPEDAHAYYDNTLSGRPAKPYTRDINHNPLPETLIHARSKIETALGTQGTRAVYVMGAHNESLAAEQTNFRDAGLVIAVPGGVRTARQMMHYAAQRYRDPSLPPIIIENTDKFWDPMLKIAGVLDNEGRSLVAKRDTARQLGIYVTRSRQESLAVAREVMAERGIKAADFAKTEPLLPPGSVLFFATSTVKKCRELQAACKAQGYDIQIRPIDQLVDFFSSPEEDRNTYQGNAAVKIEAALAAWRKMPKPAQELALQRLNIPPDLAFLAVEDSGVWFKERRLQQEPEFSDIRHLVPDNANFPGVETGPTVWGGGGVQEFVGRARQAIMRRAAMRQEAPQLGVGNVSVLAIAPLQPDACGDHPVTMTFAQRNMSISDTPDFLDDRTKRRDIDLSDVLFPNHSKLASRHVSAWVKESGARAGAMRALAVIGQAAHADHAVGVEAVTDYQAGIYVPELRSTRVQQQFRSERRRLTAHVQTYPELDALQDVQQKLFAPHDAIAMAFDNPKDPGDYARRFITYGYIFFSAMVAQQTRDKFMLGKMFAVLDDKQHKDDDRILDRLVAMTYDLHKQGAIPQEPLTLFSRFDSVVELGRAMNAAKKEMFRYAPFSYSHGPVTLKESGTPSTKDYHAAILLTAVQKSSAVLEVAQRTTEALADRGIGIVTGAGLNNGGMGVVTHTAYDLANRGKDVHHTGITTPHIRDFEASGNIEKMLMHFVLTRDIYSRMDWLSRADSGIVLPGGAGTLQELFAGLHKIARARETQAPQLEPYRHNQLVVMNTPVSQNGSIKGFYDVTLANIPPRVFDDYPIHVVTSVNSGMDKVEEHRGAMRAAGRRSSFTVTDCV